MDKKDIEFEIKLAKIGMRFGAWFAVGVAVFAIGATLLFTIYEHLLLEGQLVEEIGLFFLIFGVIITALAKQWTSTALDDLKKENGIESEKIQHRNVTCKSMNRLSRLVLKAYEFFMIFILPSIVIFLVMYYPYGFEPNIIAFSATPITSPDITYQIYHNGNQEIPREADGTYKIHQDLIETSNLSKTIMSKIFGSSLGLNDICFNNINSTFYFLQYRTNADVGIRFNFNNTPIVAYPGHPECESVMSNTNFIMELNQGVISKDPPDVILKNLYNDKNFQNYLKKEHLNDSDVQKGQLMPSIFTQVYVQPSPITWIVALLIIFIVWSGFVFLCMDLRDFVR